MLYMNRFAKMSTAAVLFAVAGGVAMEHNRRQITEGRRPPVVRITSASKRRLHSHQQQTFETSNFKIFWELAFSVSEKGITHGAHSRLIASNGSTRRAEGV